MIDSFTGDFRFLSNFFILEIEYEGIVYPCLECAYQAAKTTTKKVRKVFAKMTPSDAKTIGGLIPLRPGWEGMKLEVMENLLRIKFSDPTALKMLCYTKTEELIEGNWWGDVFYGVCKGKGENHLGKLLMKIRSEACQTSAIQMNANHAVPTNQSAESLNS